MMRMSGRDLAWSILALALAGAGAPAAAQRAASPAQQPSALTLGVENVSAARDPARAGRTPGVALPGDTLRYRLVFRNPQPRPLTRIVFDNPIPRNLVFVPGSAGSSAPATIEYSIDGGATYSLRPTVTVVQGGRRVQQPAPPSAYTHVRWRLTGSVPPRDSVSATYEVQVVTR